MSLMYRIGGFPFLAALLWAGCATVDSTGPDRSVPADGRIPIPADAAARDYLGLDGAAPYFTLCDVQAELLVVDFFDMYCHVCQRMAKHVNELYQAAQADGLGDRIKFLGLGVGNSPLEADTFKTKFELPFPVFPDRQGTVTRTVGKLRVPALVVLRKQGDGLQIIHQSKGSSGDPQELLQHLLADAAEPAPQDRADGIHGDQITCGEDKVKCLVHPSNPATPNPL